MLPSKHMPVSGGELNQWTTLSSHEYERLMYCITVDTEIFTALYNWVVMNNTYRFVGPGLKCKLNKTRWDRHLFNVIFMLGYIMRVIVLMKTNCISVPLQSFGIYQMGLVHNP